MLLCEAQDTQPSGATNGPVRLTTRSWADDIVQLATHAQYWRELGNRDTQQRAQAQQAHFVLHPRHHGGHNGE